MFRLSHSELKIKIIMSSLNCFCFSVVYLDPRLGRDNNHRRCDALLEEELRARQMQLFTGSGSGPGTFGTQVNLGSWYRQ